MTYSDLWSVVVILRVNRRLAHFIHNKVCAVYKSVIYSAGVPPIAAAHWLRRRDSLQEFNFLESREVVRPCIDTGIGLACRSKQPPASLACSPTRLLVLLRFSVRNRCSFICVVAIGLGPFPLAHCQSAVARFRVRKLCSRNCGESSTGVDSIGSTIILPAF